MIMVLVILDSAYDSCSIFYFSMVLCVTYKTLGPCGDSGHKLPSSSPRQHMEALATPVVRSGCVLASPEGL